MDGEGVTDAFGIHKYVLLGVGDDRIINKDGLGWEEIFEFLWDLYRPRQHIVYCGFFLGYDFAQWLKDIPEQKAWLLLTDEGKEKRRKRIKNKRDMWPVRIGYWELDMLGTKKLSIRKRDCLCERNCKHPRPPWMTICDVGSFFQSSFLKVIDPKGWPEGECPITNEEFNIVREGKEKRATARLDKDMVRYNALENDILARVMSIMDRGFIELGIKLGPATYYGPGQAAQQWMNAHKIITNETLAVAIPKDILESARMSYYGGWFEIMMHGIIPGKCHEYDINSAYPWVISDLPCLEHGNWMWGKGKPNDRYLYDGKPIILVKARIHVPSDEERHYIGAMPYRDRKGRIRRPESTIGWYWLHELNAAKRAKIIGPRIQWYEHVIYLPCDCLPPLRRVANLYMRRLAVGKRSPLGKAAKLVYNSMYGKFAQSVGTPKYANPIYASLITAGCRTAILDAIASHPKGKSDVAMVATDGVYFRSRHPRLPISERLGQWDHSVRSNLTLFKPGVYWDDETRRAIAERKNPNLKTRGVNAADFASVIAELDGAFRAWDGLEINGSLPYPPDGWPAVSLYPRFQMTTPLMAMRRNKWHTAGVVKQGEECKPVVQSADPRAKRSWFYRDGDIYRSEPKRSLPFELESTPYEKRFGLEDPYSQESKEEYGISPDGPDLGSEWFWRFHPNG